MSKIGEFLQKNYGVSKNVIDMVVAKQERREYDKVIETTTDTLVYRDRLASILFKDRILKVNLKELADIINRHYNRQEPYTLLESVRREFTAQFLVSDLFRYQWVPMCVDDKRIVCAVAGPKSSTDSFNIIEDTILKILLDTLNDNKDILSIDLSLKVAPQHIILEYIEGFLFRKRFKTKIEEIIKEGKELIEFTRIATSPQDLGEKISAHDENREKTAQMVLEDSMVNGVTVTCIEIFRIITENPRHNVRFIQRYVEALRMLAPFLQPPIIPILNFLNDVNKEEEKISKRRKLTKDQLCSVIKEKVVLLCSKYQNSLCNGYISLQKEIKSELKPDRHYYIFGLSSHAIRILKEYQDRCSNEGKTINITIVQNTNQELKGMRRNVILDIKRRFGWNVIEDIDKCFEEIQNAQDGKKTIPKILIGTRAIAPKYILVEVGVDKIAEKLNQLKHKIPHIELLVLAGDCKKFPYSDLKIGQSFIEVLPATPYHQELPLRQIDGLFCSSVL